MADNRIQYCSDLHLEFKRNAEHIRKNPLHPTAPVLILAGDICVLKEVNRLAWFFDFCADNFEQTFWIPGNHEFYGFQLEELELNWNKEIRGNVHLVNDWIYKSDNHNIFFTTLWSHINQLNEQAIERRLSDFRLIHFEGRRLRASDFNQLHQNSLAFLEAAFEQHKSDKNLVVTHHVPTLLNYPEKYRGDSLNEGFASEQFGMIESHQPLAWIFGHHHENIPEFRIGKTRMFTNQLGYVELGEHGSFLRNAVIQLDGAEGDSVVIS